MKCMKCIARSERVCDDDRRAETCMYVCINECSGTSFKSRELYEIVDARGDDDDDDDDGSDVVSSTQCR